LTKIKIIGDPGQNDIKRIKEWLKKSLKKFELSLEEIHLVFMEDLKQWGELYQKYIKGTENLSAKERLMRAKIYFSQVATTGYIHDYQRKKGVPPVILIGKDSCEISEESFLDETAHILQDKSGWNKLILEALDLIFQDYRVNSEDLIRLGFFILLSQRIADYFVTDILCQHGLFEETFRYQQKKMNHWIKDAFLEKEVSKIEFFDTIMAVAFWSTLPPSYPKKEEEKKLEGIVIDYLRQMSMEPLYQKIKSIVSKLESPPNVVKIYKCGSKIIELAQEFMEK